MDNFEYSEKELQKFTIRYSSSSLTAEQVGIVITQTAVMYRIIQDYLDSPYDLQLVRVSRGSYIFEFLGDPVVLEYVHNISRFIYTQAKDLWDYVGDAVTWDLIKLAPSVAIRKLSDLKAKEADEFTKAVREHQRVAVETDSVVEYDFKNKKIIQYNGEMAKKYVGFANEEISERANYLSEKYGDILPPRNTKHKRK
ncbi:hypothetical protein [Cohnella thailandensis]|uniref:Uncharacterized protein n=1 Tax=Cohnella thailandensis TaxID=557557 RepID=A0A841SUT9_9BACL|nr:hypothetical protein [Cohnella thailandensis]MBB6635022.1 hypothetical protein [Cohnella thailandensis]MBP1975754.1 hypothetical protein [Cohnella thailandensis]